MGAPPTLAAQVSAEHTLLFGSLEQPDVLASAIFKYVQSEPTLAEQLPDVTPAKATSVVGFDSTTTAGWRSAGIDPAIGVGTVLDARAGDQPYALLKIDDEPKFLAWLSGRVGATATIADGQLRAGNQPVLSVARRGDFTLIAQGIPLPVLQTIAQDSGPRLAEAPGFDAAFAETTQGGRVTGFAPIKGLMHLEPFAGGEAAQSVDFYAGLFPALGAQANAETVQVRLATTEKGLGALKQLYAPRRAAPKFSKWLPEKGFALVRVSVNLFEFFEGVQALLPPSVPAEVRTQLGFAKMGLAMVGLDWSLLTQAFTGHAAFAVKPVDGRDPEVLALFALGTPESADKIITSLQAKVPQLLGGMRGGPKVPVEEITVGGLPGKRVKLGQVDLTIVRSDAMLIFASSQTLAEEAIVRARGAGGLTGETAAIFDGDVVFAMHARPADVMPTEPTDPMQPFIAAAPPFQATVALDRHGVVLKAPTRSLMVIGFAASMAASSAQQRARDQMKALEDSKRQLEEIEGRP